MTDLQSGTEGQPASKEQESRPPAKPLGLWLFALAAASLLLFMYLVGDVSGGSTIPFDDALLRALRSTDDPSQPIGPPWLAYAARDITALGGITVLGLATLLTATYLVLAKRPRVAILLLVSVGGGFLLSSLLKIGIARPRPDIVPHLVQVHDYSFPSGHAMLSAVTWLTLGALAAAIQKDAKIRAFLVLTAIMLTLVIGASRVLLGVHYPSDVVGGWCAGAVWAIICRLIASRITGAGRSER